MLFKMKLWVIALLLLSSLASACDSPEAKDHAPDNVLVRPEPSVAPSPAPLPTTPEGNNEAPVQMTHIPVELAACGPDMKTVAAGNRLSDKTAWKSLKPESPLSGISSISVGRVFDAAGYGWRPGISWAITKDGTAWEWGFVDGSREGVSFAKPVQGISRVKQLSGSFVLTTDGQVWMRSKDKAPAKVDGLKHIGSIQQLDEMFGTLFALGEDGLLWRKERDQAPVRMQKYSNIKQMYGSVFSLFLVDQEGKLLYWNGRSGLLDQAEPKVVDIPGKVMKMAVGYNDEALIQTDNGQVHLFAPEDMKLSRVPDADGAIGLGASGSRQYMFVKKDGTVWGWGDNRNGLLGQHRSTQVDKPVHIEGLSGIVELQLGTDHALALDTRGEVYSWGSNMTGQLGRIPVMFEEWTEFAELSEINQIAMGKYFVKDDGSVWELGADRKAYKVEGPKDIRVLTSVFVPGTPITLNSDGIVQLWQNGFSSCETLSVPFRVKDIIGGEEHLLLRTDDDRLATVRLKPEMDRTKEGDVTKLIPNAELAVSDSAWVSRIKEMYANHYTFLALTEDGKVYYAEKSHNTPYMFKSVTGLPKIVDLAPEYFVRYTMEPAIVWALDDNGSVHEFSIHPAWEQNGTVRVAEVRAGTTLEEGIAMISGRLRVTKDGYMYERDWQPLQKERVPESVRTISSSYGYAIEGPGAHHHLLLTENGKLAVIGYNPFGVQSSTPGKVVKE
jgi:alpha-tubulin suppressor-like RCC1 family protein